MLQSNKNNDTETRASFNILSNKLKRLFFYKKSFKNSLNLLSHFTRLQVQQIIFFGLFSNDELQHKHLK